MDAFVFGLVIRGDFIILARFKRARRKDRRTAMFVRKKTHRSPTTGRSAHVQLQYKATIRNKMRTYAAIQTAADFRFHRHTLGSH